MFILLTACIVSWLGLSETWKTYKLNKLAKHFKIDLDNHHRADDDAAATAQIFLKLMDLMLEQDVHNLNQINNLTSEIDYKRMHPYHTTILVKNDRGLKNLYKLVSQAHVDNFHRVPRILKSELLEKREGLIIGSACEAGQLYKAVLQGKSEDKILEIAKFYDYLEENNAYRQWVAKISPWQYNRLSDRQQSKYDKERKEEWKRYIKYKKKYINSVINDTFLYIFHSFL